MSASSDTAALATLKLVADAMRARDPRRASELARAAIASGLRHPLLFNARAVWASEQGDHSAALEDFRVADGLLPSAATKNALGMCLARLGRHDEAIATFDAAIALEPKSATLNYRKGWVLELAARLTEAEAAHRRALALDPDVAAAHARLAFLTARRADFGAARTHAMAALSRDPRQTAAALALALAEAEDGNDAAAELLLTRLLDSPATGATDRRLALGQMGDIRDRQDRVADAFAFYARANEAAGAAFVPSGITMRDAANDLGDFLDRHPPVPPLDDGYAHERPHIFLLGFLRSGTTLLEQVLASRDDAVALEEKDTLAESARAFLSKPDGLDALWRADAGVLAHHRQAYWARVRSFGVEPAGKVVVDKVPLNTLKIPIIARLFPRATILFAVRDPRDVVLSCFRRTFATHEATYELLTLERAARFYDTVMRVGELCRVKLAPRIHRLRLEDLVEDFDAQVRGLCEASGLPWADTMRDFAERAKTGAVSTPSASQIARGLNDRGIGQWRRYRTQMAPVLPLLQPWAERFGYPAD